jgi:hypothetical protein
MSEFTSRLFDTLAGYEKDEVHNPLDNDTYFLICGEEYIEIDDWEYIYRIEPEKIGYSKSVINHLWEEVYHMNGIGLADYLNDWQLYPDILYIDTDITSKEWRGSQHGESVYLRVTSGYSISNLETFNRWDLWRENVSIYFDGFIREAFNLDVPIDKLAPVFVFKIVRVSLGLTADVEPPHPACNDIMFS